jgi:hypothetical protein
MKVRQIMIVVFILAAFHPGFPSGEEVATTPHTRQALQACFLLIIG